MSNNKLLPLAIFSFTVLLGFVSLFAAYYYQNTQFPEIFQAEGPGHEPGGDGDGNVGPCGSCVCDSWDHCNEEWNCAGHGGNADPGCNCNDDGGGDDTPPPPPPPQGIAYCARLVVLDSNNQVRTPAGLLAGQAVKLAVSGATNQGSFTQGSFTINGQAAQLSSSPVIVNGTNHFVLDYTIPTGVVQIPVTAEISHDSLGWKGGGACTLNLSTITIPQGCYQPCDITNPNSCTGGMVCQTVTQGDVCVNPAAPNEPDCIPKTFACVDLQPEHPVVTRPDTIDFTCTASGNSAVSAEFRVIRDGVATGAGATQALTGNQASWTYQVPATIEPGDYRVQCRVCDALLSCTDWGKANKGSTGGTPEAPAI